MMYPLQRDRSFSSKTIMTPEGGLLFGLVLAIAVCGICTCAVCCIAFCAASLWNAFYRIFCKSASRDYQPVYDGRYQQKQHPTYHYQQQEGRGDVPFATTAPYASSVETEIPVVDAIILPPLAAVRASQPVEVHGQRETDGSQANISYGAKDVWAAVLFGINVIIIFALAVHSIVLFNKQGNTLDYDYGSVNFPMVAVYLGLTLLFVSAAGSFIVYFMINNGERIIDWTMKLNIFGLIMMAVVCLVSLNIIGAVIFGVMAGLNYWYYWSAASRIPFASSVLAAACTAVKGNFMGLIFTAFAGLLFQGMWMLLWAIAIFGAILQTNTTTDSNSSNSTDDSNANAQFGFVTFLFLLSLYWGLQCIKDVVSVTSGGTVATWWFQPGHPAPVRGSAFRALTTSFGSICFGSLVLAFVTTLRATIRGAVNNMRRNRERNFFKECMLLILDSLLRCIEGLISYINRYAYSYVAAYGQDFVTSGKSVMRLFEHRGWSAIINDDLISNALCLLAILMGLSGGLVGVVLTAVLLSADSSLVTDGSPYSMYVLGAIYGGLVGLVVGALIVSVIDSAVAMVYVCFAEDPHTLQMNHPDCYTDLHSKWMLFNPESLLPMGSDNDMEHGRRGSTVEPSAATAGAYQQPGHSVHRHKELTSVRAQPASNPSYRGEY